MSVVKIIAASLLLIASSSFAAPNAFREGTAVDIAGSLVRLNNFDFFKDDSRVLGEILSDYDTERFYLGRPWTDSAHTAARFYSQRVFFDGIHRIYRAPLVIRDLSGKIVGVFMINRMFDSSFRIGYAIHPNFRNQGFGRAAAQTAIAWLQSQFPREYITATVLENNSYSRQLLSGLGFIHRSTDPSSLCRYLLVRP